MFRAPALSGGPTTVFSCPSGFFAVVKCISIVWGDVAISGVDAWLQTQDLCKLARYTWASTLSDVTNFGGTFIGWGAWTLDAGEELQAQTAAGTVDMQASGYLLAI